MPGHEHAPNSFDSYRAVSNLGAAFLYLSHMGTIEQQGRVFEIGSNLAAQVKTGEISTAEYGHAIIGAIHEIVNQQFTVKEIPKPKVNTLDGSW